MENGRDHCQPFKLTILNIDIHRVKKCTFRKLLKTDLKFMLSEKKVSRAFF